MRVVVLTVDQHGSQTQPDQVPTAQQLADAQAALDAANAALTTATTTATNTPPPTDASLDTALAGMANKPVDADVTAWAKDTLAAKIDAIAAATAPATP